MQSPEKEDEDFAGGDDVLTPDMMALLMGVGEGCETQSPDDADEPADPDALNALFQQAVQGAKSVFSEFGETGLFVENLFGEFGETDGRDTPEVTEEDFEPEDWPIFFALRTHMRALVARRSPPSQRMRHLRWMMTPLVDKDGLRFDDACEALMSRPVVVRTRALYHLWLNGIEIDERLPALQVPLPRFLVHEIGDHPAIGRIANIVDVARIVWRLPGLPIEAVMAEAIASGIDSPAPAFAALEDYGYVGKTLSGRVYFLTRNPSLMSLRMRTNFSWARALVAAQ